MKSFRKIMIPVFAISALLAFACDEDSKDECTNGEKKCVSSTVASVCESGKWKDTTCTGTEKCDTTDKVCKAESTDNKCKADVCAGDQIRVCDTNTGVLADATNCPTNQKCDAATNACKATTPTGDACTKTRVAEDAELGSQCDSQTITGRCVDGNTAWKSCNPTAGVVISYCLNASCKTGEITDKNKDGCWVNQCDDVSTKEITEEACGTDYTSSCAADGKSGSFCSSSKVNKITCLEGYKCNRGSNGFISCVPAT